MGLPGLWPLPPSSYLIKKRQKKQAEVTNAGLSAPPSNMRVKHTMLKAECRVAHELVQQELRCQNWNPLPSHRQFNKRETEAAKQLLTSVLKDTPWRQAPSRSSWIVLSMCWMDGEVLVATSTAREKLLTRALTWSFKMITGISTMPLLLQTPCDKSEPFTAGLAVIIMLFPALSETRFVFLGFRPLYQGRFLYHPLARASCSRGKLSLKRFNCMRKNM